MKIAISATGPTPDAELGSRVCGCSYFIIFDTSTGSYTTIQNSTRNLQSAVKLIFTQGVAALISGNYVNKDLLALHKLNIKTYATYKERIWMIYDKFKNNRLEEIAPLVSVEKR